MPLQADGILSDRKLSSCKFMISMCIQHIISCPSQHMNTDLFECQTGNKCYALVEWWQNSQLRTPVLFIEYCTYLFIISISPKIYIVCAFSYNGVNIAIIIIKLFNQKIKYSDIETINIIHIIKMHHIKPKKTNTHTHAIDSVSNAFSICIDVLQLFESHEYNSMQNK